MRDKATYFLIYLIPMVLTWVVLLPNVPEKSGLIYSVLTIFLWLALILYFPLSAVFREFLVNKFGEVPGAKKFSMLILVSMLTLLSVSSALMTQAVLYPVVRGEVALLAGLMLLILDIKRD